MLEFPAGDVKIEILTVFVGNPVYTSGRGARGGAVDRDRAPAMIDVF